MQPVVLEILRTISQGILCWWKDLSVQELLALLFVRVLKPLQFQLIFPSQSHSCPGNLILKSQTDKHREHLMRLRQSLAFLYICYSLGIPLLSHWSEWRIVYLEKVPQQIKHFVTQSNVFSWRVKVEDKVLALNHRIQIKAGNVLLYFFLFLLSCWGCKLRLYFKAFRIERIDCESSFIVWTTVLITIEETAKSAFFFVFFSGFREENGLSPELHEVIFAFGRSEE